MQNIHRLAIVALPAALALSACATTRGAPLPDGSDVALGQRAYVDGPLVQPVEVVEDSRCPMNARCVWAGRVRVKMVWIRGNGEKQPFEATLGEPVQLADGQFTLESVRPEKMTNVTIKPSDYRFSFRFAGGL
jgi:predicted small secreted protein